MFAACLLVLAVGCSREKPEPKAVPEPTTPIEPPVAVAPTETASAAVAADDQSIKAALLGLDRKEAAEPPPPPQRRRRYRRVAARRAEPETTPMEPSKPKLSDYQFQEAVNNWRGMRTCLSGNTLRGTQRRGAMKVAFRIRGDGSVSNCEVVETSNTVAATIAPCVERAARRIRFPAFGGEEVEKQAKFVF